MSTKRIQVVLDIAQADKNADKFDKSMRKVGGTADNTTFSINKLAKAIAAVISTQKIIAYSSAWTDLEGRVRNAVGTQEAAADVMSRIVDIANRSYAPLETTAEAYLLNSRALEELGYSTQQQLDFTEALALSLVASGAKAERAATVTNALSKAIAVGSLSGQNWNTVVQQGGELIGALADGLGVTTAELREMAAAGQLTTDKILPALNSQLVSLQNQVENMDTTIGDAFVILNNYATEAVGTFMNTSGAAQALSSSIITLAENLDTVMEIALVLGAVWAARVAGPAIASTLLWTKATIGQSMATARALTLTYAISSAIGAKAVAATTATVALNAMNRALTLVGGPAGALILAAGAITYFATRSKEATEATDLMSRSLDGLTEAQARAMAGDLRKEIAAQEKALYAQMATIMKLGETMEANIAAHGETASLTQRVTDNWYRAVAAGDELSDKIKQLQARYAELQAMLRGESLEVPTLDRVRSPVENVIAQLEEARRLMAAGFGAGEDPFADSFSDSGALSGMRRTTAQMQSELDQRRQISDIYRNAEQQSLAGWFAQERAMHEARTQEELVSLQARSEQDQQRRDQQFQELLAREELNYEQRLALEGEYNMQRLLAEELLQEQITAVEERAAQERVAIARREREQKIEFWGSMASSGIAILSAFGSQSTKTQKRFARVSIGADTATGIARGVALGWPMGIPAVAWAIATGKQAMDRLNGSGGGGSVPAMPATPEPVPQPVETRQSAFTFRLEGFDEIPDDGIFSGRMVKELRTKLEQAWEDNQGSGRRVMG